MAKKDIFKFQKEDLGFWRNQTQDLKNKSELDDHETIADIDPDIIELKAGKAELLNFRKKAIEDIGTLPDLTLATNSAGVDKNTQRKFKSGKMNISASLDMHGMTQDVAFDALISFINSCFKDDKRCVEVITGKGMLSKTGGVLRRSLPIWINNEDIRPKILSFCQSHPGAYYILLKRQK
jgi:DNA-nicking Smr family endonuclease